jgi:hypothetical protein
VAIPGSSLCTCPCYKVVLALSWCSGREFVEVDEGAVLRPSRRVVAYHFGFGTVCAVVAALGWWLRLTALPVTLAVVAVVQLMWSLRSAVGRVDLLPDSVRIRRSLGVSTVSADAVLRFRARTTVFARHVRLEYSARQGTRGARLPAPATPHLVRDHRFDADVAAIQAWWHAKDGGAAGLSAPARGRRWIAPVVTLALMVVAALPDRPWGWTAGAEATTVPEACESLRSTLDPTIEFERVELVARDSNEQRSGCGGTTDQDRILIVVMTLYSRSGAHSATSIASTHLRIGDSLDPGWSSESLKPIPGADTLGDASLGAYLDPLALARLGLGATGPNMFSQRGVPVGAAVIARRANVVIEALLVPEFDHRGPHGTPLQEPDTTELITVVRTALTAVTLH